MSKFFIVFILFIFCISSLGARAENLGSNGKTAIVMIDKDPSGLVKTTVNSRVPSEGLFKALIDLHSSGVTRVALLVHEETTLKTITNAIGLLSKADFLPVRVFYFDKYKDRMWEISFLTGYIFSENIDELKPLPNHIEPFPGLDIAKH